VRAYLFDLDGVLTQAVKVHAAAWKDMFDAFLRERAVKGGEPSSSSISDAIVGRPSSDSGARSSASSSAPHSSPIPGN